MCGNAGRGRCGDAERHGLGKPMPPEAVAVPYPRIPVSPPGQCEYTTALPSLMVSVTLPPAAMPVNWARKEGRLNSMDA